MNQDLQTALGALIALVVGWLVRQFTTPKAPAEPTPANPVSPAVPEPAADPYDGLPGLPGHPILRLVGPALLRWIGVGGFGDADPSQDETALALVAAALKKDPARAARLKSLLD